MAARIANAIGEARLSLSPWVRRNVFQIEAAAILALVAVFLFSVLPRLGHHPAIVDDEMWIFSASYKLAQTGVFGTDLFEGSYDAEDHYFFNMPGHHFAIAGAVKLLGAGIVQARLVGVAYGVATLLLTYLIARRMYGPAVAILAMALVLFLRLNMGFDTGLPLQELSVNMRYDLAPVPFMLAGFLILLNGTSFWRVSAAGALFGIAGLMQFFGAFAFPIAVAFLWVERLPRQRRLKLIGALLGIGALVTLPYAAYILVHWEDFRGQVQTAPHESAITSPSFYLDNLMHEPERFEAGLAIREIPEDASLLETIKQLVQTRPSFKLAILLGLPLAIAFSGWRAMKKPGSRGDRLLVAFLVGLPVLYALLESYKLYLYWIPMLPFLCIGIAAVAMQALRNFRGSVSRLGLAAAALAVLLVFFAEGTASRLDGIKAAEQATEYERISELLSEQVPAGSRVVGSTALWWALRDTEYRSYFLFFYLTRPEAGPHQRTISGFLDEFGAEYFVIHRYGAAVISGFEADKLGTELSPEAAADFDSYMRENARLIFSIRDDPSYGFIDVWKLDAGDD